jgi:hypothetical protein
MVGLLVSKRRSQLQRIRPRDPDGGLGDRVHIGVHGDVILQMWSHRDEILAPLVDLVEQKTMTPTELGRDDKIVFYCNSGAFLLFEQILTIATFFFSMVSVHFGS